MKSILFLPTNQWTDWGGSEKLWAYSAKRLLAGKSVNVGVLMKKWETINPALKELLDAVDVFHYHDERPPIFKRLLAKITSRFDFATVREQMFLKALKHLKPDLIVISQALNFDGLDWMGLCLKHNVPYVIISHAASEDAWLGDPDVERLALSFSKARHNFFVSRDNVRVTELQVGARLPRCSVIRNPFDVPYDVHLEYPSTKSKYRLACVGRYELNAKAQHVLLETLSDPKWKGRDVAVGLYGSGAGRRHIEKLIQLFGLSETVKIMGFLPPVEIWKTNHALVLPSRHEGLPITLVEAMMCGRIGIVTNVSGNPEVVEDNVNGFIAEAPKAVYLDGALERAWTRKSEWEVLGQQARIYIKGKVPPDPVADFVETLMSLS